MLKRRQISFDDGLSPSLCLYANLNNDKFKAHHYVGPVTDQHNGVLFCVKKLLAVLVTQE